MAQVREQSDMFPHSEVAENGSTKKPRTKKELYPETQTGTDFRELVAYWNAHCGKQEADVEPCGTHRAKMLHYLSDPRRGGLERAKLAVDGLLAQARDTKFWSDKAFLKYAIRGQGRPDWNSTDEFVQYGRREMSRLPVFPCSRCGDPTQVIGGLCERCSHG